MEKELSNSERSGDFAYPPYEPRDPFSKSNKAVNGSFEEGPFPLEGRLQERSSPDNQQGGCNKTERAVLITDKQIVCAEVSTKTTEEEDHFLFHRSNQIFSTGGEARRKRWCYSPKQLQRLEATFRNDNYPTALQMKELSKELKIPQLNIRIWFQNRRARIRKKINNSNMVLSSFYLYSPCFSPADAYSDNGSTKNLSSGYGPDLLADWLHSQHPPHVKMERFASPFFGHSQQNRYLPTSYSSVYNDSFLPGGHLARCLPCYYKQ